MAFDILQVLRFGAVDVTREVKVVIVLRVGNLLYRNHAGVAWISLILSREGIHNPVNILLAEAVLRAVLHEPFGGVDHEDTLAGYGVLFVEYKDASRSA